MWARIILASALAVAGCADEGTQSPEAVEFASASDVPDVEPTPTPTPLQLTPEQMRKGQIELRKLDADDVAKLTEGDAHAKRLAWEAEYNKSGVYTEYTKRLSVLWAARANSKRAVDCGIRSPSWRNMLLAMMQNQIYSDRSFMMLSGSLSAGEKLASDASEKKFINYLETDKIDCEELRDFPFMKSYDLIAAGVGGM